MDIYDTKLKHHMIGRMTTTQLMCQFLAKSWKVQWSLLGVKVCSLKFFLKKKKNMEKAKLRVSKPSSFHNYQFFVTLMIIDFIGKLALMDFFLN